MVDQIFTSSNPLISWLRRLDGPVQLIPLLAGHEAVELRRKLLQPRDEIA
jgi:hypothetical protein